MSSVSGYNDISVMVPSLRICSENWHFYQCCASELYSNSIMKQLNAIQHKILQKEFSIHIQYCLVESENKKKAK